MSNLVPFNEIESMAIAVSKSGLFGMKTPDQAIALMLLCQAEGLHPAIAARDYHIIQGRPALKADAMLARFQQAGGKVEWKVYTDMLWFARTNETTLSTIELARKNYDRIESQFPELVDKLRNDDSNFEHGFNSGVVAAIRYMLDLKETDLENARQNFPDLDS